VTTVARLTVLTGPHKGNRFCCHQSDVVTLGRASDCEICLNGAIADSQVSRHHCRLEFDCESILVKDLASRNGTFVNGHPATKIPDVCEVMESGDLLTIGHTTMAIHLFDCPLAKAANGETRWPDGQPILKNCPLSC
jgi:pSer/pThr/pTyr-binding forkhead associated (FHA) protein